MCNLRLADRFARATLALPVAALLAGCSPPGAASQRAERRPTGMPAATPVAAKTSRSDITPAGPPASGIVRKTNLVKNGQPACNILFRYAGHEPETLFWKEPCKAVTTRMMDRRELEAVGTWARLDAFDRRFVTALPGGRVLYVAGSLTASIYPIGSNGLTYEIPVTD